MASTIPRFCGCPRARSVEVDDVQGACALVGPAARRVERVGVERRLALVVALNQPDRASAADVDGGIEDHAGTQASTNLLRRPSPASLDFSGWNWTPQVGPRSTAQANRSPHSAVPATSASSAGRGANEWTK